MQDLVFYLAALLTVVPALLLVVNRNPVNGAMLMVLSFIGTAILFGLLHAFFLAVIQVLVYAGAIVVLFLFIVMLLDVDKVARSRIQPLNLGLGIALFVLMAASAAFLASQVGPVTSAEALARHGGQTLAQAKIESFGELLFTRYALPFVFISFLLLAAMIGVIVLNRRPPAEGAPAKTEVAP